MTAIDLTAAVQAALETDQHWAACPIQSDMCIACQVVYVRTETAVRAAAPFITSAVWTAQNGRAGLEVEQQWAARHSGLPPRLRASKEEARALAMSWGGELVMQDTYYGFGDWQVVEDYSRAVAA